MPSFSDLFRSARRRLGAPPPGRRAFLQRAGAVGAAAVGGGLLLPDEAWAGVEERAARFGITPGTVVDAMGRPVERVGSEPYLGEIMAVGWNFANRGFAACDGQLLPIAQYSALFSLLGTIYGGDGRTTFALPDLRGRVALGFGTGNGLSDRRIGSKGGSTSVTLTTAEIPGHTHTQPAEGANGTVTTPSGNVPARDATGERIYNPAPGNGAFLQTTSTGGGQAHENRPPTLAMSYLIALQGIFPSRN